MRLPRAMLLPPAPAAAHPVRLQPPAAADDPRRRADRVASARVPARPRPPRRLLHPRRRPGPVARPIGPGSRAAAAGCVILPQSRLSSARRGRCSACSSAAPCRSAGSAAAPSCMRFAGRSRPSPMTSPTAYYIRSAEALRAVRRDRPNGPATFLALQLSQYLNTKRLAETTRSPLQRLVFGLESRLIRRYEARIWRDFIAHRADRAERSRRNPRGLPGRGCLRDRQCPVRSARRRYRALRAAARPPGRARQRRVLRAPCATPPNAQAVPWFAAEVWPRIRACRADGQALRGRPRAAGASASRSTASDGITVTGTVPDPADWMAKAAVCVAPIRAAAGLQNKLLEYLAMGKAGGGDRPPPTRGSAPCPAATSSSPIPRRPWPDAILALLADPAPG